MKPIDWPRILGELIKSGNTQPQIAEACGCTQSTVSDLLNGKAVNPRTTTGMAILKMASANGVDVSDVMAGIAA